MTVQEFFDALTLTRADGYRPYLVTEACRQMIRLKSPAGAEHCPMTAVCERNTGQTFPPTAAYSSLQRLRLDPDEAYTIAAVADGKSHVPLMRQQMLAALALLDAAGL